MGRVTHVDKIAGRDHKLVDNVERDTRHRSAGHQPAHGDGPARVHVVVGAQHLFVGQHGEHEQHQ